MNRLQGCMAEQHDLKVEMLRFGLTGELLMQNLPFFTFYLTSLDSMLLLRLMHLDCDHDGDLASKSHSSSDIRAAQDFKQQFLRHSTSVISQSLVSSQFFF